jgi:hypothetical protein
VVVSLKTLWELLFEVVKVKMKQAAMNCMNKNDCELHGKVNLSDK